jgi:integrase
MGRKKEAGIYGDENGYEVDKNYLGERLRRRGFPSFASAQSWMIQEVARIRQAKLYGQRAAYRFEQAAVNYLRVYADKPSIETDIYMLNAVMPFIKDLPLEQVHNGTLAPFVAARQVQGRKNKTINLSLSVVRRILNLAARDWRDESGVTWLAQAPLITMLDLGDQRPPRPITWAEQRVLLPNLADHLAAMSLFTLHTGVRDDVVCSLQWEWEVKVPQLGASVFIVPAKHVKATRAAKADRVLVCNAVAQSVVEQQRGRHATHVFTYRGNPIEAMNNTGWQTGRKKAGLPGLHVHDLRHTTGMRLREAGVSEESISDILWHRRKSMTAHYSAGQLVEIHGALSKIETEANRWNVSLASLARERLGGSSTQNLPSKEKAA